MRFSSFHPATTGVQGSAPSNIGTIASITNAPVISLSTFIAKDGIVKSYLSGSWDAVAEATTYDIEINNGTAWVISSPVASLKNFEVEIKPSALTYSIRVKGSNKNGLRSGSWSPVSNSVVANGDVTGPGLVTGITGITVDFSSILLSWTNPSDSDLAYVEIRHSLTNDVGTSTSIGKISGTTFNHSKRAEGTTNYYWLRGVDTSGNLGSYATVVSVVMPSVFYDTVPATVSGTPTFTTAVSIAPDGTTVGRMAASWAAVSNAVSYIVHVENTTTSISREYPSPNNSTSLNNIDVIPGHNYRIKVKAVNNISILSAAWSNVSATAVAVGDTTAPGPVTTVTAGASLTTVTFTWDDPVVADLNHIRLYKNSTNSIPSKATLYMPLGGRFQYTHNNQGATEYYWLSAVDHSGNESSKVATGAVNIPIAGIVNPSPGTYGSATRAPVLSVLSNGTVYDSGDVLITPAWSSIASKPTTVAGFGITDAVSTSTYTAADVLSKLLTVDGSGSGLDADLLDGFSSADYARINTDASFATLTANRIYTTDNYTQAVLNPTMDMASWFGASTTTLSGIVTDRFAFTPPTTATWSTDGTNFSSITIPTEIFKGMISNQWGGFDIPSTVQKVRFTWSPIGYIFIDNFVASCSTNGNSIRFIFEKSETGATWLPYYTSGWASTWPGYITHKMNGTPSSSHPHFRVTIERTATNSNNVNIGGMSLMTDYGGSSPLYTWDASKNLTLQGSGQFYAAGAHRVWHAGDFAIDTAATANTVARRDGSGYLNATWFNASSGIFNSNGVHLNFGNSSQGLFLFTNTTAARIRLATSGAVERASVYADDGGSFGFLSSNGAWKLQCGQEGNGTTAIRGAPTWVSLLLQTQDGINRGQAYADSSNNIGFINNDGNWALQIPKAGAPTIRVDNSLQTIWTAANFNPSSKFNVAGGTITGVTLIHRPGAEAFNLELSRDNSGTAGDPIYLRFHHYGQWYHRIRTDNTGFSLVSGADETPISLKTGALLVQGNISTPNGADRSLTLASSSSYNYQLIAAGDHFQIREASDAAKVRMHIAYPNGNVAFGATTATSKLCAVYSNPATVPTAGTGGHGLTVGTTGYGFAAGVLTNGTSYIQSTRWDGSATDYNLWLQPNGADLRVGGNQSGNAGLEVLNTGVTVIQSYNRTAGAYTPMYLDGSSIIVRPNGTTKMTVDASGVSMTGLIYSDNWWRSTGQTGWFNATYSTGIWSTQAGEVRTYNGSRFHSEGQISAAGLIIANQLGFQSASYSAGRNRIWSFANADSYGISYFQGGTDTICMHFGDASSIASSPHRFASNGNVLHTGTVTGTEFYSGSGNYFRAAGTGGFYCETYNGGWNMTDGTWLRSIADKGILTGGAIQGATVTATSDLRLKENVTDLSHALDLVLAMQPRRFNWKKDGRSDIGAIAQELELIVPEVVYNGADDTKTVNYGALGIVAIAAIQELHEIVAALKTRIKVLEAK